MLSHFHCQNLIIRKKMFNELLFVAVFEYSLVVHFHLRPSLGYSLRPLRFQLGLQHVPNGTPNIHEDGFAL